MLKKNKKYFISSAVLILLVGYTIYVRYIGALPDAIVNFFPETQAPTVDDRVLVFAPHQDDEVLGSGALMIIAKREGAAVKVVIATNGNKNGIKAIRYGEALKVASSIGIKENDVVFWDYPDGKLRDYSSSLLSEAKNIIDAFQPTIVIIPDPEDSHRDHRALGEAVETNLNEIGYSGRTLGYLIHYHDFPRPLGYYPAKNFLPPIKLLGQTRKWTKLSLSPEVEEAKHGAIMRYTSQLQVPWRKGLLLSFIRKNELFLTL